MSPSLQRDALPPDRVDPVAADEHRPDVARPDRRDALVDDVHESADRLQKLDPGFPLHRAAGGRPATRPAYMSIVRACQGET